ncbi:MAG: 2-amino-4-hydroxy-6-hydroxymethyldihydropteridine diphosphokinase [Bacteroidales bacterium]|nr:2-amino-4-hydroxy-6-hydroxymethyldihydropteridine diphosphokinase [Bacteroidales bacterium]
MYNYVYLLLGSNLGEKLKYLKKALKLIKLEIGEIIKCSSIYETEAWGFSTEKMFLNQVVLLKTELLPFDLLKKNQEIEKKIGRTKIGKNYESRIIDIDILFYNDEIIETVDLVIPHKQLHKRMFTLMPLFELNKDFIHPKIEKSISELTRECKDKLKVKLFE